MDVASEDEDKGAAGSKEDAEEEVDEEEAETASAEGKEGEGANGNTVAEPATAPEGIAAGGTEGEEGEDDAETEQDDDKEEEEEDGLKNCERGKRVLHVALWSAAAWEPKRRSIVAFTSTKF